MLTKEKIHNTIDKLPDNVTIEEVIDQLILLDKIEQGLKDVKEGNVYSTDEVRDKLGKKNTIFMRQYQVDMTLVIKLSC